MSIERNCKSSRFKEVRYDTTKAKKICTMGTPYYWESDFEYRGQTYTVTYSSSFSSFKQTPAYIQHREAQARIDEMLDNQEPLSENKQPFQEQLDEIWEMLGW